MNTNTDFDAIVAPETAQENPPKVVKNSKATPAIPLEQLTLIDVSAKPKLFTKESWRKKPSTVELSNAVRSLGIMLESAPGELESIKVMTHEYADTQLGAAFIRIYVRMNAESMTLVEAFEPETLFPPIVHNMLHVGAKTGTTGTSLQQASTMLDKTDDASRRIRLALIEPTFLFVILLVALFGTTAMAMPMYKKMYVDLDIPMPPMTQLLLTFSDVVAISLGIFAALAVGYGIWWAVAGRKNDRWRTWLDKVSVTAPMFGVTIQATVAFTLFNVLASLVAVGETEGAALNETAKATKNRAVRKHLEAVSEQILLGKATFVDIVDGVLIPKLAKHILVFGQNAGKLSTTLTDLATIYKRESQLRTERLVTVIGQAANAAIAIAFMLITILIALPSFELMSSTLGA